MVGPGDRVLNKIVVSSFLIKLTVCGRWTVEQMGLEEEHKVLWKLKGLAPQKSKYNRTDTGYP